MKTGKDAKIFFDETLPMFSEMIRPADFEKFATKNSSTFPTFSFVGPVIHHRSNIALVGDSIHTVKPYFGLGLNSAFEDVNALRKCLDVHTTEKKHTGSTITSLSTDMASALTLYSQKRAKEAKAMVTLSRSLDGGFFTFVLPLIIDSVCNKYLPALFSKNTIAMLQNEKVTFNYVLKRKRAGKIIYL